MSKNLYLLNTTFLEAVQELMGIYDSDPSADLIVTCTLRSAEDQARLYRNGRSLHAIRHRARALAEKWGRPDLAKILMDVGPQYGKTIRTNAAPGQSVHQYGMAIDCVVLVDGKPVWGDKKSHDLAIWREYGARAKSCGLEWSGDWKRFKEKPHVQQKNIRWQDLIVRPDFDFLRLDFTDSGEPIFPSARPMRIEHAAPVKQMQKF